MEGHKGIIIIIIVDGTYSEWNEMACGIPQGSVLGHLMFLIFVNDFPEVVSMCTINLYADHHDTTLYYTLYKQTLNTDLNYCWMQQADNEHQQDQANDTGTKGQ